MIKDNNPKKMILKKYQRS